MKKIFAIITVAMIVAAFVVAGCTKQEAPKKVESVPTSTMTSTVTATTPAAPTHK